jgi:hypothetical protein
MNVASLTASMSGWGGRVTGWWGIWRIGLAMAVVLATATALVLLT